jgi:hypothetical protein
MVPVSVVVVPVSVVSVPVSVVDVSVVDVSVVDVSVVDVSTVSVVDLQPEVKVTVEKAIKPKTKTTNRILNSISSLCCAEHTTNYQRLTIIVESVERPPRNT